eukprot:CAMPEP_0184672558 /NCGR_PEP_ID=MMETSP0308-20130426/86167_1 /TAXON_ID=38269 /ORGANISM="Gloeochaete witrockiana, Strain SAG 46.84" /LENGTH=68 /DNA_ID=CAMNT_0027119901 /DNA_START=146 /DNA_END=352 /DNA_ORIENTATION=+
MSAVNIVEKDPHDDLSAKFYQAAEDVQHLNKKPSDIELLVLYGLYKIGTVGAVTTSRPDGFLDVQYVF